MRSLRPEACAPAAQAGDPGYAAVHAPPADAPCAQETAVGSAHRPSRRRHSHHTRREEPPAHRSVPGGCSPVNRPPPWLPQSSAKPRNAAAMTWVRPRCQGEQFVPRHARSPPPTTGENIKESPAVLSPVVVPCRQENPQRTRRVRRAAVSRQCLPARALRRRRVRRRTEPAARTPGRKPQRRFTSTDGEENGPAAHGAATAVSCSPECRPVVPSPASSKASSVLEAQKLGGWCI